jgi:uncharacterized protein YkwD
MLLIGNNVTVAEEQPQGVVLLDKNETEFFHFVNLYRSIDELPPLEPDPKLMDGARHWAAQQRGELRHAKQGYEGECVANVGASRCPAFSAFLQWYGSDGHRRIMRGWYNLGGIGFHNGYAVLRTGSDDRLVRPTTGSRTQTVKKPQRPFRRFRSIMR